MSPSSNGMPPRPHDADVLIVGAGPGGTTAAALSVLMDDETGFPDLLRRAVAAAANRGRELAK